MFQATCHVVIIMRFVDKFLVADFTGVWQITSVLPFMLAGVATTKEELTTKHTRILALWLPCHPINVGRPCYTHYPPLQRDHNQNAVPHFYHVISMQLTTTI